MAKQMLEVSSLVQQDEHVVAATAAAVLFPDCSQGGLREGLVVELSNGSMALVIAVGDDDVTLDANNMMAGKTLCFELEVVAIDKQQ
jgi:FKBP-type peptidyl-prolyl cis-trans isomerase 2